LPETIWNKAKRVIPGLQVPRAYRLRWLRPAVRSALTISAMLVPQALAYAQLAGVRPSAGLYSAIVGMFAYALFGSSRHVIVGPEAGAAILTAAILARVGAGGDAARYASLAALLALILGVLNLGARLFEAGGLADFLSKPILVGYINGAALIIIGSQLARLLGLERTSTVCFGQIAEVVRQIGRVHIPTLILGLAVIAALLLLKKLFPRLPGPLLAVAITTFLAVVFQWRRGGIQVVGPISSDPPQLGFPSIGYGDVRALLPGAFSLLLVNYASAVLTARNYADKLGYRVDSNQEFLGQGIPNIAAGLVSGFPVTASDSRTAVNASMGGRTQLVSVIAAVVTLVFTLYLTPLLTNLPIAALAAVVVVAAIYLLDVRSVVSIWRVRPVEGVLATVTTLGVVGLGILEGILIAVALALGDLIRRAARPHDAILGEIEGKPGYHDIRRHEDSETIPGLIIYRVDAPLFFANARFLRERVRELLEDAAEPVRWVVLDAGAVFDLDVTAADALERIRAELSARGIVLAVAQPHYPMRRMLRRSGLMGRIGGEHVFPTVGAAVAAFAAATEEAHGEAPPSPQQDGAPQDAGPPP